MTISYSDRFLKLLWRWKGSLWKAIWKNLLLFLLLYYIINVIYRFVLTREQQESFIKYVTLFNEWTREIPLTFLLGFYVAMVVRRWWEQCQLISWPDSLLFNVSALIRGNDPETRIIRRTIARYSMLSSVLAWRSISLRVLARYPTENHLVLSGLMTKDELAMFQKIQVTIDPHQRWFVPLNWIQTMMVRCFEKGTLSHTNELRVLLDSLEKYRQGFFQMFIYDWITIPLVYTQVASISVYGYFAFALIGRQFPALNQHQHVVDLYVPVFTILQFLFYVGWLKVGEDLMFPFGADDEDIEFNYILDRNLEIAYLIVDELHNQVPPVYVESLEEKVKLLHTRGSNSMQNNPPKQHLRNHHFPAGDLEIHIEKPPVGTSKRLSTRDSQRKDPSSSQKLMKREVSSFSDLHQLALGPLKNGPNNAT
ncbi:hypothetical protein QR680_000857 [Steinernema hermaphroditum]|uniref:Bestrophin homolog n=1 Tax=Steinernema hermaphroditum TaxID=289476 RepID=A0AA39LEE0_9BILA|nr:hypothetical protein QR680_000857 [Steinernema hermaphroditum]